MVVFLQELYTYFIGGNLSEERFPPYPLPKTFNTNFSPIGCVRKKFEHHVHPDTYPMGLKFHTESFRKGV